MGNMRATDPVAVCKRSVEPHLIVQIAMMSQLNFAPTSP